MVSPCSCSWRVLPSDARVADPADCRPSRQWHGAADKVGLTPRRRPDCCAWDRGPLTSCSSHCDTGRHQWRHLRPVAVAPPWPRPVAATATAAASSTTAASAAATATVAAAAAATTAEPSMKPLPENCAGGATSATSGGSYKKPLPTRVRSK